MSGQKGMPAAQAALVTGLLFAGLGLLGWAAIRAFSPGPDLAKAVEADLEKRGFAPLSGELASILADPSYKAIPSQEHPLWDDPAPAFALEEVDGKEWSLEKRKPGPLVLVFYYGYHCDHCVSQLFALDKDLPKFQELGAEVVAISADESSLTRQRYAKYGRFGFPVLSDPGNKVAEKYGAYKRGNSRDGVLLHATILIGREGKVEWANRGDEPFTENRTLLKELARMEKRK